MSAAADLRVVVTAPDGRTGSIRLLGAAPPLTVELRRPDVLLRSLPGRRVLPGGPRGLSRGARRLLAAVPPEVRRDVLGVDLDVHVDGRRLLVRRDGRWRAGSGARVAVAGVVLVLVTAVGGAVVVATAVARRRRP